MRRARGTPWSNINASCDAFYWGDGARDNMQVRGSMGTRSSKNGGAAHASALQDGDWNFEQQ